MTKLVSLVCTLVFVAGFAVLAGVGVTACKQGEGDICQINDDCSDGLVCNAATGRCQQPGAGVPDASTTPVDAAIDAPIDAAIDAAVDAAVDAMP